MTRVLIIDDESELCEIVEIMLYRNFDCDSAKNFNQAREKLSEHHFDLILIDLALPDGKSVEFLGELKRKGVEIPSLIISDLQLPEREARQFLSIASGILVKPFDEAELRQNIEASFDLHRKKRTKTG